MRDSETMPAGTYVVGDPCYAVPDDRWEEWLEKADSASAGPILLAELDEKPVLGIHTASGDGRYLGSDGEVYPVDAGLIGLVPIELIESPSEVDEHHYVRFEEPFECYYDNGTINLGHIQIDTDL